MSKIISPGCGFKTKLHRIDGKFCNSTCGLRDSLSIFNCGTREVTSVIIIAIPLKDSLQHHFVLYKGSCSNETTNPYMTKISKRPFVQFGRKKFPIMI